MDAKAKAKAKLKQLRGMKKESEGKVLGNREMQAEGREEQLTGRAQEEAAQKEEERKRAGGGS